ncbi:hypothetical protein COCC4DRAFT_54311 [Bipolaris maydis ATCC 48331]|uniref:DUF914-domain-containing protein n=2 Tax=Cochliobolus heterostrophus TaxID=5016 RepID=M2TGS3_COCH5|nr:uncharacterized protein COCC4DRAFT_54311 [Bipolaris maydis ATCC 48331]EMD85699.1 hypothetical protein COCHEDRAFT_1187467 [Bipolaris maydis C5]KAJ5028885.1 hypothetical protein J3E73DRAFT_380106 [Bipolaris maydis]ENH99569.1 hypothetical protein COCC4DRAFT_54311 [Bipolaris maydis ATCC 48331]KAJ5063673.1 hypothetical protein J3E74DRAFT_264987 [Bipolaris maydis]KAJ6199933.1 hypothetical protein J3E72DRAFT_34908 [Bipolaris maydis]
MNQVQVHPAEGVVVQDAHQQHYDPQSVHKTGAGHYVTSENESHSGAPANEILERDAQAKGRWFQYIKTKQFWLTLVIGQVLAICITSTNTFSSLLSAEGTSIPAFQTFFNYVLLNIIYTSYTLYKYGFKKWARLVVKDGWRFFILAFMDVEGNYFVVLAYRYTTILSAQLINFWAIAVVVIISFFFLKVRYHYTQIFGILLCIGGLGVIFGSDHITGSNNFGATDQVKGDLFALLGATFYGLSNVFEEWLVSERPLYEVVGQLAFWGMFINGTQAGIFDRAAFRTATWNADVAGYIVGYTLILSLFYSLAPVLFRMSSAAFFNISLLTGSFWGVAIGVKVFGLKIHWMYPIAFVLIIIGQVIYFLRQSTVGEALKPWLGKNQERGHAGLGTAKRRVERPEAIV